MTKIIWVTGASSGIGASLAQALARNGHTVAATARSSDKLTGLAGQTCGSGKILAYPGDITDKAAIRSLAQQIVQDCGRIDTAIFSAGTYHPIVFDADTITEEVTLNILGTVNCLDAILPIMRQQKSGHIALVASVAGYRGLPRATGYGATKAALISMAESLYLDLKTENIQMQVISPGFVKTPLTDLNDFPMPFIISSEKAATIIVRGLQSRRFEIVFPWQMHIIMKIIRYLPYPLYFAAIRKQTGAGKTGQTRL